MVKVAEFSIVYNTLQKDASIPERAVEVIYSSTEKY